MKVRYRGNYIPGTFTDGKVYEVIEYDDFAGGLRIIDDSEEECGYLFNPNSPKPNGVKEAYGKFEIVEDNEKGDLKRVIKTTL